MKSARLITCIGMLGLTLAVTAAGLLATSCGTVQERPTSANEYQSGEQTTRTLGPIIRGTDFPT